MGMDGDFRLDDLKPAAASVSRDTLDDACSGLKREQPRRSAHYVLSFGQIVVGLLVTAAAVWAFSNALGVTPTVLHYAAVLLFATAVLWRLVAASNLSPILWRLAESGELPTYTILCPLYREANVAPDLVSALARIDYPTDRLDIKLLVEADDPDTIIAALAVAGAPHIEVVIIPACAPRTKPKALNIGLARARGEFVAVYDAEDRPHPQQLRAAIAAFEDAGETLACVQAPLAIDNAEVSWISRQFAAEYAIQFREILPLLARLGLPLPLGGTSNHFRGLM